MKIQFNDKNNNTQIADDDTTTQIQIGFSKWWVIAAIILMGLIIAWKI